MRWSMLGSGGTQSLTTKTKLWMCQAADFVCVGCLSDLSIAASPHCFYSHAYLFVVDLENDFFADERCWVDTSRVASLAGFCAPRDDPRAEEASRERASVATHWHGGTGVATGIVHLALDALRSHYGQVSGS